MAKCKTCGAPVNLAPDGDPRYDPPIHYRYMRLLKAVEFFLEDGIAEDSQDLNQVAYTNLTKTFEQSQTSVVTVRLTPSL